MIFVVEDDAVLRRSLVEFLGLHGQAAEGFESAEAALEAARQGCPDVVVSDVQLPGMGGLELLDAVAALDPTAVRVAVTAHGSVPAAVRAIRAGAYDYLEKPVELERLLRLVVRATRERQSRRELDWQRARGHASDMARALMGSTPAMARVRDRLAALAAAQGEPPPVLITGETGVGKGLVARALHDSRLGADAPFIEVNCVALPVHLVEGELFGHERAAFTDARAARAGLVEAADGGTLFLDEVGDLGPDIQAKLLQVLESRQVRRLGAVRTRPVRAAVVSATNVPLGRALADGRFRPDLFHRLAAITLPVPPLRERGDALEMARVFLADATVRYRSGPRHFAPDAEAAIRTHTWPGNLRELRFAVERAVLLSPSDAPALAAASLALHDLPPPPAPESPATHLVARADGPVEVTLPAGGVAFEQIEKAVLRAALAAAGGNVVRAARLLDLSRDTLRYRIRKFGLEADDG
ncbi:MAG: sigma-54-dependent Fis family transcriptional regulator [Deltaproteobacteria bacterium]|nr:sigma-54-dependent Fis family transcriptional regulator [Deltaproteobacteria bacterium]